MNAQAGSFVPVRDTASAEETEALGATLAPLLEPGDLVALTGPLGAGKTRFAAGVARGLGYAARVRSPTFTLLHEYAGERPLYHADLYRLESREVDGLGLDEALERGPLLVEWAERLPASWLADAIRVAIEVTGEHSRRVSAAARGPRGAALLEAWRARV